MGGVWVMVGDESGDEILKGGLVLLEVPILF